MAVDFPQNHDLADSTACLCELWFYIHSPGANRSLPATLSQLIMVDGVFDVFLDLVYKYLVEYFDVNVDKWN